jgi:hypothetical protein
MMGRVTFEGPVKSNGGYELGSSKSKSNVAGTPIFPATIVDLGTQTTAASVTMNCNSGSVFKLTVSGLSNGTVTLTPIGGYAGQTVIVYATNSGTVVSIAFASSSALTIEAAAASTSIAIGSTASLTFLNIGAGFATPTTSNVLMQQAAGITYYKEL